MTNPDYLFSGSMAVSRNQSCVLHQLTNVLDYGPGEQDNDQSPKYLIDAVVEFVAKRFVEKSFCNQWNRSRHGCFRERQKLVKNKTPQYHSRDSEKPQIGPLTKELCHANWTRKRISIGYSSKNQNVERFDVDPNQTK